jgi:hypothetical protein
MVRFVLHNLTDDTLSGHAEWDDAWAYARLVTGGMPEGNVRLYETTRFDPSTFTSEYAPGRRMRADEWARVKEYWAR